jgi:hypothetical protein
MPGFNTVNDVIKANTVNNRGKRWDVTKQAASFTSGKPYSLWPLAGDPGAGAFSGTVVTATAMSSADNGAVFFDNPSGGRTNHLTALMGFLSSGVEGELHLVDRLLQYPGFVVNTTADQAATTVTTLPRYTDGLGVKILVEVSTILSANTGTLEVYYRNESNVDNRVGAAVTLEASASASPCRIPGLQFFHTMQAPDRGILRINKIKLPTSTYASGNLCVSLVKPIWSIPIIKGFQPDLLTQTVHGIKIENSACLMFLFQPYSTGSFSIKSSVFVTEN